MIFVVRTESRNESGIKKSGRKYIPGRTDYKFNTLILKMVGSHCSAVSYAEMYNLDF